MDKVEFEKLLTEVDDLTISQKMELVEKLRYQGHQIDYFSDLITQEELDMLMEQSDSPSKKRQSEQMK
ncbi:MULTISPECIES: hypothetical protein [Vibrio]|nr:MULTISPECIES: hypothetical protein [Vibrio]NAW58309.1 hypothetical protein [Vibrio sp. V36_P2S2PM302]NAX20343.1 hypothetical protein [Vibrio sp. V39_P1S14PM300]NAX27836.1 hypothetical protein [Vibrio sp. V38_P2S17PM301]NAX28695.1 hypothetical protein [Vibrio sp. V37_P2S8PM304]